VISWDVRRAIAEVVAEAGGVKARGAVDPGLRPDGTPGRYTSSVAFELAKTGDHDAEGIAADLARRLGTREWIAKAEATGAGFITIAVTAETLTRLPRRIDEAGFDCVRSDALAGQVFAAPPAVSWETAATWEKARETLAAELTARLACAAGAAVEWMGKRADGTGDATPRSGEKGAEDENDGEGEDDGDGGKGRAGVKGGEVAAGVAFAGGDAVRFALARAVPGNLTEIDPAKIARHLPGNPAYAVRYAHARAASGVRWAAAVGTGEASPQRMSADPGDMALFDALSWLPERVATAARRGRPDEFARYLENVADLTLAALASPERSRPASARAPGSARLALARAARTGLAAGLALLGISAPDRL
jgi:arginyl-tRNA synthetase